MMATRLAMTNVDGSPLDSTVIEPGQTVTVSYRAPAIDDDRFVIQDRAGNDAASFTGVRVENRVAAYAADCRDADVWCATMTVGAGADGELGYFSNQYGALSDTEFDYDGNSYRINNLGDEGELILALSPTGLNSLLNAGGFTLVIDGRAFPLTGTLASSEFGWDSSGLSWSVGDTARCVGRGRAGPSPRRSSRRGDRCEGTQVLLRVRRALDGETRRTTPDSR